VDDIRQGELVLFSGTPCQIAGIKTLLAKEDTSSDLRRMQAILLVIIVRFFVQ
jgi:coenzyme F420-reducing hydrogenase beta subunit